MDSSWNISRICDDIPSRIFFDKVRDKLLSLFNTLKERRTKYFGKNIFIT